jgi:lipid A oxidase
MLRALVGLTVAIGLLGPRAAHAEIFLDAFTGKSFTQSADLHVRQASLGNDFTVHDVGFDDKSFVLPPYYGFRGGYYLETHPWLGFGVEFFHFKILAQVHEAKRLTGLHGGTAVDAVVPVDSVVQRFDVSHGVNYVMLNGYVRHGFLADETRFPHGRIQAYGGGGVGPVIGHPENEIDGVENKQAYELAGVGGQLFLGARLLVCRFGGLFAEYKYTLSNLDVGVHRGSANVDERTHHIVFGLTTALPTPW